MSDYSWMFYWIGRLVQEKGYFFQLSRRGTEVVCYLISPEHISFVGMNDDLEKAIWNALEQTHEEHDGGATSDSSHS